MSCRRLCRFVLVCVTVCSAALVPRVRAAQSSEVSALLSRGRQLLQSEDWQEAAQVFGDLLARYPGSAYADQFLFYRSKAHYYAGEYDEATEGFTRFIVEYGDSPQVPHAHFFLGNASYLAGNHIRAARSYFATTLTSHDEQLSELAAASLAAILSENSSIVTVLAADDKNSSDQRCLVLERVAKVLVNRGDSTRASELLTFCRDDKSPAGAKTRAATGNLSIKVGLLLPFSGDLKSFAEEIYRGATVAAELRNNAGRRPIRLIPYDTKGDPVVAARLIDDLVSSGADAAIGPLTSEEAMVMSARLACASLPAIIPAATQAGLTQLCKTAFQLSPNIELEGVRMAEYAVATLAADSAVIITSTAAEHLQMATAFKNRFQRLGGTVVATEFYRPGDKDFQTYIKDVKRLLLGVQPDSIYFINADGDTLEPDAVPVRVDCLYLPGSPDQIRLLLPQLDFLSLGGAYLGSDGWGDDAVLSLGDNVTKQAIFPSPFLPDETSEQFAGLAAVYESKYGSRPDRLAALGFDAVELIAEACDSRDHGFVASIAEHLRRVQDIDGAAGRITFGEHRENIELRLFRIVSGRAVPLESTSPVSVEEEDH
ncbi:MAG TPA: penicillin-binding protein activator [Candidatus Deferrimicrobium sp.]|nr:penicillin-binding protein activator [Candidatus Deferrimicrobium sp.]